MILNPCFIAYASTNIAEHFTQPVDYFQFSEDVKKVPVDRRVNDYLDNTVSMVIAGGGGILRDRGANIWRWLKTIAEQIPESVPFLIWGMGINDHGRLDCRYDDRLADLERRQNVLIGLRDRFYRSYVPCASCMRPEFDATFTIQHEVGLYAHHAHQLSLPYPTMSNRIVGDHLMYFSQVLQFLGSCDVVLTNTYHGAYWATLLNRRVVVLAPFSNKFFGFKYEPTILPDSSRLSSAIRAACRYPEALADSRKCNVAFYERALAFGRQVRDRALPA